MSLELLHFRDSDKILKDKEMNANVINTLEYLDDVLTGTLCRRELFRQSLDEMGWIADNGVMTIIEGRRYRYKGFKKDIAIEGNFSAYEYILEGLFRLQIGYDKGLIETGILILNAKRSEKTPYGSTSQMVKEEIESLHPTINMPLGVALFRLGEPEIIEE